MESMTIGKLAKEADIGVETIRFYEREGLIPRPSRVVGEGYRKYDPATIERLDFIRRAKELGFSLKDIKDFLSLKARTKSKCASVKAKAEEKLSDVEQKISDLEEIRNALKCLLASCVAEAPTSECPILDAFSRKERKPCCK